MLRALVRGGRGAGTSDDDGPGPEYTIVFPPTMLWSNFQRPHNVLTHLARHHPVRCLFNDWTVREERLEQGRLIVTKRAFRSRMHHRPLVYYFSIPEKIDYLTRHRLRPDLLVFELMDLPEEEFVGWQAKLPKALDRSHLIRTTNPAITDYLRDHYAASVGDTPITTSYNGVDLERFDPDRSYRRPMELEGVTKPILGFYGNLDWWIDWALIGELAERPEYQVVVIGDTEGQRPKIPPELRPSSILWIGRKPVEELPAYLDCFDVALFPFVVNAMTDAVDPLKVWEYLAFGKPVLATPTAFVQSHRELFDVVVDGDVDRALSEAMAGRDDPARIAARRSAAAQRDWRRVAGDLHRDITEALRDRA